MKLKFRILFTILFNCILVPSFTLNVGNNCDPEPPPDFLFHNILTPNSVNLVWGYNSGNPQYVF